jgi:hypothetical protein
MLALMEGSAIGLKDSILLNFSHAGGLSGFSRDAWASMAHVRRKVGL